MITGDQNPEEEKRLQELLEYYLLDSSPDKALNEWVEIASVLCNMPISLISFVAGDRQLIKAKVGVKENETSRDVSFCHYAIQKASIFVSSAPESDPRFKENPFVTSDPGIRYYAATPLVTSRGYALGTLCVADTKKRNLSKEQLRGLEMIGKKVMKYLEIRKLRIEQSKEIQLGRLNLRNLTDQIPGAVFQMESDEHGHVKLNFISKGIRRLHPALSPQCLKKDPFLLLDLVHPDDIEHVKAAIKCALHNVTPVDIEYRVSLNDGKFEWHRAIIRPKKDTSDRVQWFGLFQSIDNLKEYQSTLEQIAFDLSHVLRKPVSNLSALVALIENDDLNSDKLKSYGQLIKLISDELEKFTVRLNNSYSERKTRLQEKVTGKK